MCLILFAYRTHPRYRLILAANRDEFYTRPTAPMEEWPDRPGLIAGRDLKQMGTWMGVTTGGRFAAITNFRAPHLSASSAPSRGHLVSDFLADTVTPEAYLKRLAPGADQYNGFNLIVGDGRQLCYFSNHEGRIRTIEPGIHGLSNHLLDTPWPKVARGTTRLAGVIVKHATPTDEALLSVLQDLQAAEDASLPDTGVGLTWERVLSPIFIASPGYGTRSSSVLKIDLDGNMDLCEWTWQTDQTEPRKKAFRHFRIADGQARKIVAEG